MFGWFRKRVTHTVAHYEDLTLDFVNGIRETRGFKPLAQLPAGDRTAAGTCVIANALSDVGAEKVYVSRDRLSIWSPGYIQCVAFGLPEFVSEFVEAFDCGYYSHLDIKKKPERATLVYKMETNSSPEKPEEARVKILEQRLEALEASHIATSQELRKKIRELKGEQEKQDDYRELPV